MPMSPDKLKEILEAELRRIGVRGVRLTLPTRVAFHSEKGEHSEDMTPGQALDFLESVPDGSVETFDQLSDRQVDYLNEEEDAQEEEEESDESEDDEDDEDEDEDPEDPEDPEDDDER